MPGLVAMDGTEFELAETETIVGRGDRQSDEPAKINLARLPGGVTVSRYHARLVDDDGQWMVEAAPTSTNVTRVDGFTLPRGVAVPLRDGARLNFGEVALTFRGPEADLEIETTLEGEQSLLPLQDVVPIVSEAPPWTRPSLDGWVGRLPGAVGFQLALDQHELTRVHPFEGLMIDEGTWADGHDYHRTQQRLHQLSGHGWGIVEGLEVVAEQPATAGVMVRAGVAVDPLGRLLVLHQDVRLRALEISGVAAHVVIRYAEELAHPQRAWDDEDHHTRVLERPSVTIEPLPPAPPAVELARIVLTPAIRDARDPTAPADGEIDLRFRRRAPVAPPPELLVGDVELGEAATDQRAEHRTGLRFLLREVRLSTAYRPRWAGAVTLSEVPAGTALLYAAGSGAFELEPAELARVTEFLASGGVLFADPCHAADWEPFVASVRRLAEALKLELQPVEHGHPLLVSRHVFFAPPGDEGALLEAGGIVLSTADYGCAWRGGRDESGASRDAIRAALEIGTNVAIHARQRQRPLDVLELEA
jgi:pSer/pThr/pTyr-binding forkhead associated (FHA) protein